MYMYVFVTLISPKQIIMLFLAEIVKLLSFSVTDVFHLKQVSWLRI